MDERSPDYNNLISVTDKLQPGWTGSVIRYRGFPGATDIQTDLDKVLQQVTEADLYQKTRQIYASEQVYKTRSRKGETEDC